MTAVLSQGPQPGWFPERGLPPGFSGEWLFPLRTTIADSHYSQWLCSTKFPRTLNLPILLPGELQG